MQTKTGAVIICKNTFCMVSLILMSLCRGQIYVGENLFKAPVSSMRGGLGSFVFHCGSQKKVYVERSSRGQVLVCNMQKWICTSKGMPIWTF